MKTTSVRVLLTLYFGLTAVPSAWAQGTAFTYQGRLSDGTNAAKGIYDLPYAIRQQARTCLAP